MKLSKVTRPDLKFWQFSLSSIGVATTGSTTADDSGLDVCQWPTGITTVGSIEHPDGITGTFTLEPKLHGRSNVIRNEDIGNGVFIWTPILKN